MTPTQLTSLRLPLSPLHTQCVACLGKLAKQKLLGNFISSEARNLRTICISKQNEILPPSEIGSTAGNLNGNKMPTPSSPPPPKEASPSACRGSKTISGKFGKTISTPRFDLIADIWVAPPPPPHSPVKISLR